MNQIDCQDDVTLADRLGKAIFDELRAKFLREMSTAEIIEDDDA